MDFKKLANQYRDELLDNVLPFWLEHSQDLEFGGYFSCLDREGKVFEGITRCLDLVSMSILKMVKFVLRSSMSLSP